MGTAAVTAVVGMGGDAGGYGFSVDDASKARGYAGVISGLGNSPAAESTLRQVVSGLLSDGEDDVRVELLTRLDNRGVREFLPELRALLSDPSPTIGSHAADLIRSTIWREALDSSLNAVLTALPTGAELVSTLESPLPFKDEQLVGVPFLNHENGHYYEFIPISSTQLTWKAALRMASKRRFRGMEGYLVTVTSEAENNFLKTAFVGRAFQQHFGTEYFEAWAGATDEEAEGEWTWVCGPESGKTFWSTSEGGARGFANWLGGAEELSEHDPHDYLLWRTTLYPNRASDESGVWLADFNESQYVQSTIGLIVEYSPNISTNADASDGEQTEER